jgi:hypothetical protein
MSELRENLTRIKLYRDLIRDLGTEYENNKLPKGRAYQRKLAQYNEGLTRAECQVNAYGKGSIFIITLLNSLGQTGELTLNIPPSEISLYVETFYPGWSIINKSTLLTGALKVK